MSLWIFAFIAGLFSFSLFLQVLQCSIHRMTCSKQCTLKLVKKDVQEWLPAVVYGARSPEMDQQFVVIAGSSVQAIFPGTGGIVEPSGEESGHVQESSCCPNSGYIIMEQFRILAG